MRHLATEAWIVSLTTLRKKIAERFPTAVLELDTPLRANGSSFLDVRLQDHSVNVEWRKNRGYGVSSRSDLAYGEGVDETYTSEVEAFRRVLSLLLSQTKTTPRRMGLRELREEIGLSQTELGDRMSVQQASISKIEQGRDLRMSTLSSWIAALGGKLSLAVRFPDGAEHQLDLSALMGKK